FPMLFTDGKTSGPSQLRIPPATDRSSRRRGLHRTIVTVARRIVGGRRTQPWMSVTARSVTPRQSEYEREPTCLEVVSDGRHHYETTLSGRTTVIDMFRDASRKAPLGAMRNLCFVLLAACATTPGTAADKATIAAELADGKFDS